MVVATRISILAFLILFASGSLRGEERPGEGPPPGIKSLLEALADHSITLSVRDGTLEAVTEQIRKATGVNVVVDPKLPPLLAEAGIRVNLRLKDISGLNALDILLDHYDLARVFQDGALLLTTKWGLGGPVRDAEYDIAPLLETSADRPWRLRDLVASIHGLPPAPRLKAPSPIEAGDLLGLVQDEVAPGSWDGDEHRISIENGRMFVKHTAEAQEGVRRVLRNLRRLQGPEVTFRFRALRLPTGLVRRLPLPGPLDAECVKEVDRAASALRQPFKTLTFRGLNGVRSHGSAGCPFSFTRGMMAGERNLDEASAGLWVDVRPLFTGREAIPLVLRLFLGEGETRPSGLPRMPFFSIETFQELPAGRTALVAVAPDVFSRDDEAPEGTAIAVLGRADPGPWQLLEGAWGTGGKVNDPVWEALRRKTLAVEYSDRSLDDLLEDLSARLGVNVVVHPNVYKKCSMTWLHVDRLSFGKSSGERVLGQLLEMKCLKFQVGYGAVHIVTRDEPARLGRIAMMDFPLLDLVLPHTEDLRADFWTFTQWGPDEDHEEWVEPDEERLTADTLLVSIRDTIAPESWNSSHNLLNVRRDRLIAWNRRDILEEVGSFLDGFRAKNWEGVVLEGTWIERKAGDPLFAIPGGASLSATECDRLAERVARGDVRAGASFLLRGVAGRLFHAAGGKQTAFVSQRESEVDWEAGVVLDGWAVECTAFPEPARGRIRLCGRALSCAYESPENAKSHPGRFFKETFRTDLSVPRGGGVILGGSGCPGEKMLLLRIR